jgi:hypothetical protein
MVQRWYDTREHPMSQNPVRTTVIVAALLASACGREGGSSSPIGETDAAARRQQHASSIENGSFETGLAPWTFAVANGAAATQKQDTSAAADGTQSEAIHVSKATAGVAWSVNVSQRSLAFNAGDTVTVSFSAKADAVRPIEVGVQQSASPWQWHTLEYFQLGTTWQSYTLTFVATEADSTATLHFDVGDHTGTVWIDKVALGAPATTTPPPPPPSTDLAPPAGYAASQIIFEDKFNASTLDSTKWIPQIADENGIWRKTVPAPYSACDAGSYDAEYYDPAQVSTGSGLRIQAEPSTAFAGYSWKSGAITTHGKFTFTGGYAQIRAKMPDSSSGMWAGLWFLEGGGEIDLIESGYSEGGVTANHNMAVNVHSGSNGQKFIEAGVDLSADYHVYGMEYVPGQSVKLYLDGRLVQTYTQNIGTGGYTIVITLNVAQNTEGWHTLTSGATPVPSELDVSEVQVYGL